MPEPRSAKQVIDQAIKENRLGEWLCYGFATTFVIVGVDVIGKALLAEQSWWTTLFGGAISGLFWPAMTAARQIRRENLAIRLLEASLSRAETGRLAEAQSESGLKATIKNLADSVASVIVELDDAKTATTLFQTYLSAALHAKAERVLQDLQDTCDDNAHAGS